MCVCEIVFGWWRCDGDNITTIVDVRIYSVAGKNLVGIPTAVTL